MQVVLVHLRAAGEIVHRPHGERPCRAEDQGEPAERSAKGSNGHHLCCHVSRILRVVCRQAVATVGRRGAAPHRSSSARARRSSGRTKRPTAIRWPSPESSISEPSRARARPAPRPARELDLLGPPAERAGDREAARPQHHAFMIGRMAGVDERGRRRGEQLGAGERQDQRRTQAPEQAADAEADDAQAQVDAEQLPRGEGAVALHVPAHRAVGLRRRRRRSAVPAQATRGGAKHEH